MLIEQLNLSARTYNALKRRGIDTVEQLTSKTDDELRCIRYLNEAGIIEIRAMLELCPLTNNILLSEATAEERARLLAGANLDGLDEKGILEWLNSPPVSRNESVASEPVEAPAGDEADIC